MSSVLGGFMGIGQVQVRIMMAYSSISHWGWVVGLVGVSVISSFCYYFFYFVISVCVFYFLAQQGRWRLGYLSGFGGVILVLGFLSLGGMPPMTGFVPKLLGIQVLSSGFLFVILSFLILGSLLRLYYYLRFLFVFFVGEVWGSEVLRRPKSSLGIVSLCVCLVSLGFVFYERVFFIF